MRIAVISDIHANLPALQEVLNGIDSQKVNTIYCLGDLVNQNVWNNEVIELIRKRNILATKGNHDEGIGAGKRFSLLHMPLKRQGNGANRQSNIRFHISLITTVTIFHYFPYACE